MVGPSLENEEEVVKDLRWTSRLKYTEKKEASQIKKHDSLIASKRLIKGNPLSEHASCPENVENV